MSAKKIFKPLLSEKDYLKIYRNLSRARFELNEKMIKAICANANLSEYGAIMLEYFNQFRSDAERIVAIMDVFFLGLNLRKIGDDMNAEEKARDEKMTEIIEVMRKKGEVPQS